MPLRPTRPAQTRAIAEALTATRDDPSRMLRAAMRPAKGQRALNGLASRPHTPEINVGMKSGRAISRARNPTAASSTPIIAALNSPTTGTSTRYRPGSTTTRSNAIKNWKPRVAPPACAPASPRKTATVLVRPTRIKGYTEPIKAIPNPTHSQRYRNIPGHDEDLHILAGAQRGDAQLEQAIRQSDATRQSRHRSDARQHDGLEQEHPRDLCVRRSERMQASDFVQTLGQ